MLVVGLVVVLVLVVVVGLVVLAPHNDHGNSRGGGRRLSWSVYRVCTM